MQNNLRIWLRKIHIFLSDLKYIKQYNKKFHFNSNDSKKKIVFLVHDLYETGSEILGLHLIENISKKNYDIVVVSLRPGPLYNDYCKYAKVIIKHKGLDKIAGLLRNQGYKKVICNTAVAAEFIDSFKKVGFHTITLIHELKETIEVWYGKKCKKVISDISCNSDLMIFPSSIVKISYEQILGYNLKNYIIKDQGLYFYDMRADADDGEKVKTELGIYGDRKIVLGCGAGDEHRKGFDLFLDAARLMKDKNILFIWLGYDSKNRVYKKYIRKYGLTEFKNVLLLPKTRDFHLYRGLYTNANIFFLSSREDPYPSVVLEAFSTGTPVVAFNGCGGYVDIVKNGNTGFLVNKFDIEQINTIILQNIYNTDKMKHLSENCLKESEKHNFDSYCNFLLKV